MHFLNLMRFKNLLMIVLTVILIKFFLIDSQIQTQSLFWTGFFLFLISTLSFTASGYVFNDIYDVKADIINKPKKFIVSKHISKRNAWILTIGLFLTGLTTGLLAAFVIDRIQNIFLLLVPFICVILYSIFLKRIAILGNGIIAICAFWIFPLVYSFKKNKESHQNILEALSELFKSIDLVLILMIYGLFSFFITFIREIIKDIEDIDGDYNMNMKTLPILLGIKRTRNIVLFISFLFTIGLVLILKELFSQKLYSFAVYSLICVCIPFLYFIYILWAAESKKEFTYLSKLLKTIMFFGILSMLFFKFS